MDEIICHAIAAIVGANLGTSLRRTNRCMRRNEAQIIQIRHLGNPSPPQDSVPRMNDCSTELQYTGSLYIKVVKYVPYLTDPG
ncbi:hypothetical protein BBBOND_0203160 [Babesia bigemina]|uniref:Uncharacterized protein n=1 Tax=Babesia bigemina TaxID=5866 RepID=A0A061D8B6_BABBI|nr:hypothetical protein BBBOND_0203160 [Babesia bigemina]CDR95159.1 hypothetical protein BBBOND_0203160 [Babesia bigemina]|eukprot:XP_012767345.1 hypothetical protein BBBOND_0203160 [Babesia bigemina]